MVLVKFAKIKVGFFILIITERSFISNKYTVRWTFQFDNIKIHFFKRFYTFHMNSEITKHFFISVKNLGFNDVLLRNTPTPMEFFKVLRLSLTIVCFTAQIKRLIITVQVQ